MFAHTSIRLGLQKNGPQALGRSRGGLSTKLHLAIDSMGRPLRLIVTEGQVADISCAAQLVEHLRTGSRYRRRGLRLRRLRARDSATGEKVVIPPRPDLKRPYKYSKYLYKKRNHVERGFNKLKHFRRLSTRFDRNDAHFSATVTLASIQLWLRNLYVDSA